MVDEAVTAQQIARGKWQPRPASRPMRQMRPTAIWRNSRQSGKWRLWYCRSALLERLHELIEAELAGLMALREGHRDPSPRTRIEACWPLRAARQPLALRFHHGRACPPLQSRPADRRPVDKRHPPEALGHAARPCVAVDGGLLDGNPFSRVKLRLGDDSACEVQTR
jgi:hypothetical protein